MSMLGADGTPGTPRVTNILAEVWCTLNSTKAEVRHGEGSITEIKPRTVFAVFSNAKVVITNCELYVRVVCRVGEAQTCQLL